jgi:biopolymer transport protein ExbB
MLLNQILLLFQTPSATTEVATEVTKKVTESSIVDLILESGPFVIGIFVLLFVLSFLAVYIFVERYLTIKNASKIDDNFMNNIRAYVSAGNISGAKALCQSTNSPVARMVEKGLMRIGKPLDDIEHAIENVGKLEVYKLEKNTNILSIIAGVAPMFGFLGTIAGMIQIFYSLSTANNLNIGVISGGIYVKMFSSGTGLIIGIFGYVAFNYLDTMINRIVNVMERSTFDFIDLLQEPAN